MDWFKNTQLKVLKDIATTLAIAAFIAATGVGDGVGVQFIEKEDQSVESEETNEEIQVRVSEPVQYGIKTVNTLLFGLFCVVMALLFAEKIRDNE